MPRPKGYKVSAETKAKIAAKKAETRTKRLIAKTVIQEIHVSAIVKRAVVELTDIPANKRWNTKLWHPNYVVERCPACGFPEAEGGFCPDCNWMRPVYYTGTDNERHQWFPKVKK